MRIKVIILTVGLFLSASVMWAQTQISGNGVQIGSSSGIPYPSGTGIPQVSGGANWGVTLIPSTFGGFFSGLANCATAGYSYVPADNKCELLGAFSSGLGTSYQDVTEIAAPTNPAAGNDRLYLDSTTHLLACLTSGGANCMPIGTLPSGTQGQPLINAAGTATYATSGIYLDASQFAGSDWGIKVNACLSALALVGGGTCDARAFTSAQTSSVSVTVGDGTHNEVLMLPPAQVTFASGKQLIYRSLGVIIGTQAESYSVSAYGSKIACDATVTTSCVVNYDEHTNPIAGLYSATLEKFSIIGNGTPVSGSTGLEVGAFSNVYNSTFRDVFIYNFDQAAYGHSPGGCTCYNNFDNVTARGITYGFRTGVGWSSNIVKGGQMWGATGIYAGGGMTTWIHPDIEGSSTHAIDFEGSYNTVQNLYIEASACILMNGSYDFIMGSPALGGGALHDDICAGSTSTTSWYLGPSGSPPYFGVYTGILFGSKYMNPGSSWMDLTLTTGNARNPLVLAMDPAGATATVYGIKGPAPLSVGQLIAAGGIKANGLTTWTALGTPSAPTLAGPGATGGATTYQYAIVCKDWNLGTSLQSATASTTTGNATLSGTNYISISYTCPSGYGYADILKFVGGTWQSIALNQGNTSPTAPFQDTGQAASAYTVPTRNNTADVSIAGNVTVGGGTNQVYRCSVAGTLPVGALTTVSANCGTAVAVNLIVN